MSVDPSRLLKELGACVGAHFNDFSFLPYPKCNSRPPPLIFRFASWT